MITYETDIIAKNYSEAELQLKAELKLLQLPTGTSSIAYNISPYIVSDSTVEMFKFHIFFSMDWGEI